MILLISKHAGVLKIDVTTRQIENTFMEVGNLSLDEFSKTDQLIKELALPNLMESFRSLLPQLPGLLVSKIPVQLDGLLNPIQLQSLMLETLISLFSVNKEVCLFNLVNDIF